MNTVQKARIKMPKFSIKKPALRSKFPWFTTGIILTFSLFYFTILLFNFYPPELKKIETINKEQEEIKKQIIFWQQTTNSFPGYRDSYIKLAILNWKLFRDFDSQKFLEQALQIDPNNEVINKLLKELR